MGKTYKMLVIEDNENDLFLLKHELKKSDYDFEIVHVYDFSEFKSQVTDSKFDIIISDYSLPGFTAENVLDFINTVNIKIPVIVLSGNIGEDIAVSLIKNGANDFILKDRIDKLNHVIKREIVYFESKSKIRNLSFKFSNLFEGSSDLIGTFSCEEDKFGMILNMNNACIAFLTLKAKNQSEFYIQDFLEDSYTLNDIKTHASLSREFKTETKFRNPEGKSIFVDLKVNFISLNYDKLAMFVARDISERKRFEEEIVGKQKELQMRLKQLTSIHKISMIEENDSLSFCEAMDMIVSEISPAFPVNVNVELSFNGRTYSCCGYEGISVDYVFPLFREFPGGDHIKLSFFTESNGEYILQKEEKEYIFSAIEVIIHLIDKEKSKIYVKEKETIFTMLFEANHSIMLMSDANGKITDANMAACEFYGYSKDEFRNLDLKNLEKEADFKESRYRFGNPFSTVHLLKNGLEKEVVVYSGFGTIENNIQIALYIIHDITPQKAFENTLKKVISDKDLLLKEVHHRVKNNLQIVSSILILESLKIKDKAAYEIFENIQQRLKLMSIIHRELYEYDNLLEISLNSFVNGLFMHIYTLMNVDCKCKSYSVEVEEIKLDINKTMDIGQILNELLSNAFKHGMNIDRGKIIVKIRKEGHKLKILVFDNGNGFPDDFEDVRINTLGYILMEELTEKYSGSIDVKSKKGLWGLVTVILDII